MVSQCKWHWGRGVYKVLCHLYLHKIPFYGFIVCCKLSRLGAREVVHLVFGLSPFSLFIFSLRSSSVPMHVTVSKRGLWSIARWITLKSSKGFSLEPQVHINLWRSLCKLSGKALHAGQWGMVLQCPVQEVSGGTYRYTHKQPYRMSIIMHSLQLFADNFKDHVHVNCANHTWN